MFEEGEDKGFKKGIRQGEAERSQLEAEHTQLEAEHTQLKAERSQLEAEHTQLKAELKASQQAFDEQATRIAELESMISQKNE